MILSKYQDKNTMWHDKPCRNGEPKSNNAYIYSAYSKYLSSGSLDHEKVQANFHKCLRSRNPLLVDRIPNKETPPMSKDEIIGMVSLGLLDHRTLKNNHYNFCNISTDFDRELTLKSAWIAADTLYSIEAQDRNFFWQQNMVETYCLAFKLAPWDIYYIKRKCGITPTLFERVAFSCNMRSVLKSGNRSTVMMLWLQLRDMGDSRISQINLKQAVKDYFGVDHPFYRENFE